ncbi:MAG: hypothetical protein WCB53_18600 [Terriglobales bacterium]
MTLFVFSKTAVTPWMAQENSSSLNQTFYLQATTGGRPVAKWQNKTKVKAPLGELTIKSVEVYSIRQVGSPKQISGLPEVLNWGCARIRLAR